MFDAIAWRYDLLNRLISLGMDGRWRRRLVAALALGPRAHVLDVACGTADVGLTLAAMQPGTRVVGVDTSVEMLEIGGNKLRRRLLDGQVRLIFGDAEALPFGAHTFDACTMAFGIRNVGDRPRALREMVRVCRPDRPVAILELCEPQDGPWAGPARLWVHRLVPALGAWLSRAPEYRYLSRSIAAFPPPARFRAMMAEAGLGDVQVTALGFGALALFVGRTPKAGGA